MCRSKNVLIVDDNSDDQYLICMLFRRMQMSFYVTFCSLADARKKLSEVVFDVIVIDGAEKSMGYDLISDIKSSASCKAKIIVFSSQDEYVAEEMSGADYRFSKSILLIQPMKFSESFDSIIPVSV